jgi:hypothetical protein
MDYSFWTSTAMKFGIQINSTLETDSLLAIVGAFFFVNE